MNNTTFEAVRDNYNGDNKVNYEMREAFINIYKHMILRTAEAYHAAQVVASQFSNCRSLKTAIKCAKELDAIIEEYGMSLEEMEAETEKELNKMTIEQALGYAMVSFDQADARQIEVEEYKCTTKNKSIIKFYHCGFEFRIERDDDNDICWIEYALTGYEFKEMFGVPLHNQGYNFLTGQIDTDKHYMTNLEIIAMILKNMVNNDYIGEYLDETETEEVFITMMEGDE